MIRVRLLWSEAGAVCDLGFCASLDRLKGSSPLRSWVLRPGREKGAVPGVCAVQEGRGRGVRPVPGAVRAGGGGLEDPGHAASSTTYDTYGSRTVTHWHDQVTPEEPHPIEKAVLPSAAAAHGRVGTHCPPRNRWQRRTGRSGSWPRPAQHRQLDPIALALVKRDTAMSRSCP